MNEDEIKAALEALPKEERNKLIGKVLSASANPDLRAKAARENGKKGGKPKGTPVSEEHKRRLSEHWAQRRAEKVLVATPKRPPGRPRKEQAEVQSSARPVGRPRKEQAEPTEPKRPRGRPRKSEAV